MNNEFYEQYHQNGGEYLIPTEVFNDLLEENEQLRELIEKIRENMTYTLKESKKWKHECMLNNNEREYQEHKNTIKVIEPFLNLIKEYENE